MAKLERIPFDQEIAEVELKTAKYGQWQLGFAPVSVDLFGSHVSGMALRASKRRFLAKRIVPDNDLEIGAQLRRWVVSGGIGNEFVADMRKVLAGAAPAEELLREALVRLEELSTALMTLAPLRRSDARVIRSHKTQERISRWLRARQKGGTGG